MLTPSFDIKQDEEFVIVTIRVPYMKASEAEFHISGTEFKFYCKPYFLRLHFPGKLTEDGRETATFDVDAGTMVVRLPKLRTGEHFENLGMLTTLLSKKPAQTVKHPKPLIEVVGGTDCPRDGSSDESASEFDWQLEQVLPDDNSQSELSFTPNSNSYGFANQHRGVFTKLKDEIPNIIDCPNPDHMTSHERRLTRIAHEEESFDHDHYLADLMDNDAVDCLLKYEPQWKKELCEWKKLKNKISENSSSACVKPTKRTEADQDIVAFSTSEKDALKNLPNKDYLLDKATARCLYLSLIDIIFAFAYDHRTTEGEGNVESAWTICKLSSTLSWLEVYRGSAHDVVYSCLRRSLCYPLYRHWQLSLTVLQDTRDIFRLGRRKLLQCLLSVHHSLSSSDPYYLLNNLYLTDYCVWIQKASVRQIQSLADDLDEVCVPKESLGWQLTELEDAARLALEDGSTVNSEGEESDSEGEASDGESADSGSEAESEQSSTKGSSCDTDKDECKVETGLKENDKTAIESVSLCSTSVTHTPDVKKEEREEPLTLAPGQDCQPGILEQLLNLTINSVSDSN